LQKRLHTLRISLTIKRLDNITENDMHLLSAESDRELWLTSVGRSLAENIVPFAPIPDDWHVSCGWAPKSAKKVLGVCFKRSESADGTNQIFITPNESDPVRVAAILLHELLHAADDCASGHRGDFAKWAREAGFETPLTKLHMSERLTEKLQGVVNAHGAYPHPAIRRVDEKKQTTRMLKVECVECGFLFRCSNSQLQRLDEGAAVCPCCGEHSLEY